MCSFPGYMLVSLNFLITNFKVTHASMYRVTCNVFRLLFLQRKVMELKRASLIQNTPPSTPRNSMLLVPQTTGSNSSSQMFNLQEFLTRFDPEDTPGPGIIREMEETESQQHLRSRLRSSQQSVSQVSNRSKSSSSLHSAPSTTSMSRESMSRENLEHQHMPVIANPAAMANMNTNNSNNNNSNDVNSDGGNQESAPVVATTNYNGSATLVEGGVDEKGIGPNSSTPNFLKSVSLSQGQEVQPSVISWGDASSISVGSRSLSSNSATDVRFGQGQGTGSQSHLIGPSHDPKPRSYSTSAATSSETNLDISRSTSSEGLTKSGKPKSKRRSLFKRHFYRSSDNLIEEPKAQGKAGKPPLVQRKFHKSEFDLADTKRKMEGVKKRVDFSEATDRGVTPTQSDVLSLSRLTDLRHRGEMSNVQLPGKQRKKTKKAGRRSLQPRSLVPSRSQECLQEESESGSDELVSLTDILSELDPNACPKQQASVVPAPQLQHHNSMLPPSPSPRSPGRDSIWQEYGCV